MYHDVCPKCMSERKSGTKEKMYVATRMNCDRVSERMMQAANRTLIPVDD